MIKLEKCYVECDCSSPEHAFRFVLDTDEMDPELWMEVQLHHWRTFWKRLVVGIKYIFGYQCRYGYWDCCTITYEESKKIREVLEKFERLKDAR